MSCWYASACMVAYYRSPGPRQGLPAKWAANTGITLADFSSLAAAEGLKSLLTPAADLTENQLETILANNGPIWSAGFWDGVGHIVVLTGVDKGRVFINDPSPTVGAREESLAWYNAKLAKPGANVMMYMPA
ncbi:hypothetical protein IV417_04760 [Alphaproteobacteria bacterium KMM 3653]|uniref:Uncharacterized protein n=2 Tax=Harenicola maris TaxID=2841044 RepID=A0AAP2CNE8_9RHOB|nr:hypothetical protein [Harenicola maris]